MPYHRFCISGLHFLLIGLSITLAVVGRAAETKTQHEVATEDFVFTPKDSALPDNVKLDVGSPDIQISDEIGVRLGGASIGSQLKPTLENLLFKTGRFNVLINGKGSYTIKTAVTDLKVSQGSASDSKSHKFIDSAVKIFKSTSPELKKLEDMGITIDTQNESLTTSVDCTVSVQIIDESKGGLLFDSAIAELEEKTTIKDMRMQVAGLNLSSDGPVTKVLSQYNTKVVERAACMAINKLLPRIDKLLASTPAQAMPTAAASPPSAPAPDANARMAALTELANMRKADLITDEEYKQKKAEILTSLTSQK